MKPLLVLSMLLSGCGFAFDLVTIDGVKYTKCEMINVEPYVLRFTHETGVSSVPTGSVADLDLAIYAWRAPRDGRFWFERGEAIYRKWASGPERTGQSLEEAMRPIKLHNEEIQAYARQIAEARARYLQVAAEDQRKQKLADDKTKRVEFDDKMATWRLLSDPRMVERMLRESLWERYIRDHRP